MGRARARARSWLVGRVGGRLETSCVLVVNSSGVCKCLSEASIEGIWAGGGCRARFLSGQNVVFSVLEDERST